MKREILVTMAVGLLACVTTVQAQNLVDLVSDGGFEGVNAPDPGTNTTLVGEWFTAGGNEFAIRAETSPTHTGSRSCRWHNNWGQYSLVQTLGVTIESGKDYGVDLWHAIDDPNNANHGPMEFDIELWTSATVEGPYALVTGKYSIFSTNTPGVFANYADTFSAAELTPYVGQYIQLRIYKFASPTYYDFHVDDVKFGPIDNDAVVLTDPAELSMPFGDATGVVTGEVAVSYLEGVLATNVTLTAISVEEQSNPGAFANATSLPLTLTSPDPASEVVSIAFDNNTAGLIAGQTATGMVEIVWNEVGSASSLTSTVPVSAEFLQVNENNILAIFDNAFNGNADRTLSGVEATITAGNKSTSQGSTDTTYGTLTGSAPVSTGAKIGNGDVPVFVVTITNNTGFDAVLDSLHFDAGRMWPGAPESLNVAIGGDVSSNASIFFSTNINLFSGQAGDYDDFDVDLTGLADRTLADGEGATFEFTFAPPADTNDNFVSLIVDNIAVIGSGTAGAILTPVLAGAAPSDWVSLGVSGSDTSVGQALPMVYTEGAAQTNIEITSITFSDETLYYGTNTMPIPGAFGYVAILPVVLSTPEVTNDAFTLTFDNTAVNMAPGNYSEALVTVEWNEIGAATRTVEFYAYAARPAIATDGVIAQFDLEFLTPDAAINGVLGWMDGGNGLDWWKNGCLDGTFGSLGVPAAATNGGHWRVQNTNSANVATLTVTNKTAGDIELTAFHFDVGRWYDDSPAAFTLSVSGGVTADPALLVVTNLTEIGWQGTDFDDFDVALTNLADHTLSEGEAVVFTFDFVPDPNPDAAEVGTFIDNLALVGLATIPATLSIANNGDGTVTLSWDTAGTLQSADTVDGTYSDVAGSPASPAILPSIDAQKYYRVLE